MADTAIRVPGGLTTRGLIGRRYKARFLDAMLLSMISAIAVVIERALTPSLSRSFIRTGIELGLYLTLWIGYGTVMESSASQATLGKRWAGLRVYDQQGRRIAPLRAFSRNLIKDGPFLALQFAPSGLLLSWLLLGVHIVAVHRNRMYQAIHDRLAGTWVAAPDEAISLDSDA
jgi:uncharacterized RDD family membrane protein YckC